MKTRLILLTYYTIHYKEYEFLCLKIEWINAKSFVRAKNANFLNCLGIFTHGYNGMKPPIDMNYFASNTGGHVRAQKSRGISNLF